MGTIGNVLLDYSVVIAHFRGNTACTARLAECEAHGAYKSAYTTKHLAQIEKFLDGVSVLESDGVTARHYGQVRSELSRAGTLITASGLAP